MAAIIGTVDDSIGVVGMSYRYDHGGVSPDPPPPNGDVDLTAWLKWTDRAKRVDCLLCFRREVFDDLKMPSDGRGPEQFMLRLTSKWKIRIDERPGGMVYTDAANRLTDKQALLLPKSSAIASGLMHEEIIQEFGPEMRKHCPDRYLRHFFLVGRWYFLGGRRLKGAGYMIRYLMHRPNSLQGWTHLFLGLIGPKALKGVISLRKAWRAAKVG